MKQTAKKPFCYICLKLLSNNVNNLRRHEASESHQRRFDALRKQPKINNGEKTKCFNKLIEKVKTAELRTILFIVQNNLPFILMKPLVSLIKSISLDPLVVKEMGCGKTKACETTNGILYRDGIDKMTNILRKFRNFLICTTFQWITLLDSLQTTRQ